MNITTPKGEIRWATINGAGKTDLNGRNIYTADVVVSAEEAAPMLEKLEAFWEENKPKGAKAPKSMGYKTLDDGSVVFTLKTATTYPKSGDPKKIEVYDAKAKQVAWPDSKKIGNGSIGRLSGVAAVYDAGSARGVTLYLDAIQLVKLVEYTGSSSNSFAVEADGFSAEDLADSNGFVAEDLL